MSKRINFTLLLLSFMFTSAFSQTDTVYADALSPLWYGGAWGNNTANLSSVITPFAGATCVEITYPEWGSYGFDHRSAAWEQFYYFYPNQYTFLNFRFNPGNDVSQIAALHTTLDLGADALLTDYLPPSVTPNTWYHVRIPVSAMDPEKKPFFRVYFSNASSALKPHIFLDNICFEYVSDSTAPIISSVKVSDIEQDAASISWKSDEPTRTVFKFRVQGTVTYDSLPSPAEYSTIGSLRLKGLLPKTTYDFTITCRDHQRDALVTPNVAVHTGGFTTPSADTALPVISQRQVISVYQNRVVLGWETNEPAMTQVDYGIGNYSTSYVDSILTRKHTVVLTHLSPSTNYQYRIASQDKFGNRSELTGTPAFTVTTAAASQRPSTVFKVDHPVYQWNEVGPQQVPWDAVSVLDLGYLWPHLSDTGYTLTLATEANWYGFNNWIAESKKYIASGHAANRKVICMLGGAGSNNDSIWNKATAVGTVNTFSKNITGFLKWVGFDGASLDWENEIEFPSFVRFAKSLRAEWPEAYIDVPAGFNGDDAVDFAPMKDVVDTFTPMSYMAVPQWGGWLLPVPVTPLQSAGSNQYGADVLLQRWKNAGVPASKVLLGIGGFGAVWGDANKDGLAPVRLYVNSGYPNGEAGPLEGDNVVTWSFVHSVLKNTTVMSEQWDELSQTAYWTTGDSTKQAAVPYPGRAYDLNISLMFCETARSMSRKVEFVETNGMKGFSVWTLSQLMENGKSGPVLDVASLLKFDSATEVQKGEEGTNSVPREFALSQNYPNPFNPSTELSFTIPNDGVVTLKIFNALGQEVATLINGVRSAGTYHRVTFDAHHLASGVYFARLQSGGHVQMRKMMLLK
jgi:hypothetical protein